MRQGSFLNMFLNHNTLSNQTYSIDKACDNKEFSHENSKPW